METIQMIADTADVTIVPREGHGGIPALKDYCDQCMFPARYRQEKTYNNDGSGRHGGGFALCDYHATELYLALKGAFATEKPKMIEPTVVNRGLEPGLEYYVEMTPVEGLLL